MSSYKTGFAGNCVARLAPEEEALRDVGPACCAKSDRCAALPVAAQATTKTKKAVKKLAPGRRGLLPNIDVEMGGFGRRVQMREPR